MDNDILMNMIDEDLAEYTQTHTKQLLEEERRAYNNYNRYNEVKRPKDWINSQNDYVVPLGYDKQGRPIYGMGDDPYYRRPQKRVSSHLSGRDLRGASPRTLVDRALEAAEQNGKVTLDVEALRSLLQGAYDLDRERHMEDLERVRMAAAAEYQRQYDKGYEDGYEDGVSDIPDD